MAWYSASRYSLMRLVKGRPDGILEHPGLLIVEVKDLGDDLPELLSRCKASVTASRNDAVSGQCRSRA